MRWPWQKCRHPREKNIVVRRDYGDQLRLTVTCGVCGEVVYDCYVKKGRR